MADFSNSKFEISVLSENIFMVKPFENAALEMEDGKEMRQVFKGFANDLKYGILIDASHFFTSSPEMRKLVASKEYARNRFAAAFVTKLLANRLFGNFFMTFYKTHSPTRIFSNEKDALEWLKEHRKLFYTGKQLLPENEL